MVLILVVFIHLFIFSFIFSPLPSFAQTGPEEDFVAAQRLYQDGVLDLAAQQFQNFIEKYPDHELCDQAQYWTGMQAPTISPPLISPSREATE